MARRRRRKRQPLHYPLALEQDYRRALQPIVELCHQAMKQVFLPALPLRLPISGPHMDAEVRLSALGRAAARQVVSKINKRALAALVTHHAKEVDRFQYVQLRNHFQKQLTVTPIKKLTGGLLAPRQSAKIVDAFVEENVALIQTIPEKYFESLEKKIVNAVKEGTRVETLAQDFIDTYGVSESKANLIARDQVGKLYGDLNRTRQSAVGITTYIWRTVADERVRETHAELEDTVQSWEDPPVTNEDGDTNHPGEDYQCRCTAEPNLDELEPDEGDGESE